jgi:hypothetical protein
VWRTAGTSCAAYSAKAAKAAQKQLSGGKYWDKRNAGILLAFSRVSAMTIDATHYKKEPKAVGRIYYCSDL